MTRKIKKLLKDKQISFSEFFNSLADAAIGDWDSINPEEIIKEFVAEKMKEDIYVSHILSAVEDNPSMTGYYKIWLGNSAETPEPIDSKQDLADALGLDKSDMEKFVEVI